MKLFDSNRYGVMAGNHNVSFGSGLRSPEPNFMTHPSSSSSKCVKGLALMTHQHLFGYILILNEYAAPTFADYLLLWQLAQYLIPNVFVYLG
jgi:hypothetical protein